MIKIPIGNREAVYMDPAPERATCDAHEWPSDGLAARLVAAMRERHGKGGVNACRPCIERAKLDADKTRRDRIGA